ncbi:MAG: ATP-binding cassette domain-containing protein, partial [Lachnospiraceae bacterium]|nr:ATP-binding cassette domain-containing protein [Lachnospiraceae bacterium]
MLEVKDIYKSYDNLSVLKGVSVTLMPGEIYGLIGRNGAGKTTLLNILSGLLKKDSGEVKYSPDNIKTGYLPDNPGLFEYLTAAEYLDFLLRDGDPIRRNELLKLVDIPGNIKISKMSRGMKQRIGIAAALTDDPDIILLDEPTSALDPQGRMEVMKLLTALKASGKSVILSTHILADMEKICDRVGFLSDGIIKKEVTVSEINGSGLNMIVSFTDPFTEKEIFDRAGLNTEMITDRVLRVGADDPDKLK